MIYTHSSECIAPFARPTRVTILTRLRSAVALYRQRARLAELDDAALLDIGVTRAEAMHEAKRPFWDAPVHWQQ